MSADLTAGGGLNRYTYGRNSPIEYTDPSGLTALIACGTGYECESGAGGASFKNLILAEWQREGRFGDAGWDWLGSVFDNYFMPAIAMYGFNGAQSAAAAGVVFMDVGGLGQYLLDVFKGQGDVGAFLSANSHFFGD